MRKRFEQQPFLDYIAIKDIDFDDTRKSNRLEHLYRTLDIPVIPATHSGVNLSPAGVAPADLLGEN